MQYIAEFQKDAASSTATGDLLRYVRAHHLDGFIIEGRIWIPDDVDMTEISQDKFFLATPGAVRAAV